MNPPVKNKVSGISGIILQYLAESGKALDAETLWLELRLQGHSMSICSVYINVKKLARINLLYKTQDENRKYIYQVVPLTSPSGHSTVNAGNDSI